MDLVWLTIAVNDVAWIAMAFFMGLMARLIGLPPLVGFLLAGFILNTQDSINKELFDKLSDIGITLLLFTVGLKVKIKHIIKPHVSILSGIHMSLIVLIFGVLLYGLALLGISHIASLNFTHALLIAFALSFSSTVFIVKTLEERGELNSLHGRIAIGILIVQDIAAVIFFAFSTNKIPSIWALSLIFLIPLKFVFGFVLKKVGRGELLSLYGIILAMGGAEIFELVGLKGGLGALIIGMLLASTNKSDDLSKSMAGFKDLFLLGFFISIGLSGQLTTDIWIAAIILTPLIFIKAGLFFALLISFKIRARTSFMASINLMNYSEFGLIVTAIAVNKSWISNDWLIILAIAMSLSFIISAIINNKINIIFSRNKYYLRSLQRKTRLANDHDFDIGDARVMVLGMGTLGTGAYDTLRNTLGSQVIGVDIDSAIVRKLDKTDRKVIQGDPSDADFWDRINKQHSISLILLTLPKFNTTLSVIEQLKEAGYKGEIAATTRYPEEAKRLSEEGIMTSANIFTEAGSGFARHVTQKMMENKHSNEPVNKAV